MRVFPLSNWTELDIWRYIAEENIDLPEIYYGHQREHGPLRIATAGSVDDGKSTLIGRLLYDSKALDDDVLAAVEDASRRQHGDYVNLALVTDGLRAEREQGVTIDVAYRYFSTPTRKFILADTPGHVQYTRNMVTGASTAEAVLIMIDARNGVVEQSRRHAVIASLLGIDRIVVCVNKMDLVGYEERAYEAVRSKFTPLVARLDVDDATFIPMSALNGDNVVEPSANMPLEYHDYRGYAGSVASGVLRVGQRVRIVPSGVESVITTIEAPWGAVEEARAPDAVTVQIADDLDVTRGEMICGADDWPAMAQDLDAVVCWMDERTALRAGNVYRIKHTTRSAKAVVTDLVSLFSITSLTGETDSDLLWLNEIGHVKLRVSAPLAVDDYTSNRVTGSFILIDEGTNATVAAGMIGEPGFAFSVPTGHR
ncbi:Bifunctional enzyme CysN/CysC [Geodia barretti]|uniref:Bifunctional enzyme CysN/CysC n=1 Tax=Geodia barretti TaxID=519541 RepID=A0AA35RNR7_GEOBA|nr:Bifunctional enzyme CysN/CysC [Geodia barretti]